MKIFSYFQDSKKVYTLNFLYKFRIIKRFGEVLQLEESCTPTRIYQPCKINKGDVLLEFSTVKWVLNEDHSFYSNLVGTLLSQNFVLDNSYFIHFFDRTNDC